MSWTVSSVMTREVATASPDTPFKELVERIRALGELETRSLAGILVRLAGAVEGVVAVDGPSG